MLSKQEIKRLYGLASQAGIVDSQLGHDDDLHLIVYSVSGKESVKELTKKEYREVIRRIDSLLTDDAEGGMITYNQQRYAWGLMSELMKLSPSNATKKQRMAGVVSKALGITSSPKNPLLWVDKKNGQKLIEVLKGYVKTEKRKAERNGANGGNNNGG